MESSTMYRQSYTYADIGLVPTTYSEVSSRSEVNTSKNFLDVPYSMPILNAPMATVASIKLIETLNENNIYGVFNRTDSLEDDLNAYKKLRNTRNFFSIGQNSEYEFYKHLIKEHGIKRLCIDVANGFHLRVGQVIRYIKSLGDNDIKVIAGNIGSLEGYIYLASCGADAVRVGIGNGAACTTSIATGVGMGQVTLLREIDKYRRRHLASTIHLYWPEVIADGGIREVGDICKALALGADMVMLGSMLAGHDESGGEIVYHNTTPMKRFSGQASSYIKGTNDYVEGESVLYPSRGPLDGTLKKISDGLRSCISYMGGNDVYIFESLNDDNFCLLSPNARIERTPHSKEVK
jgi:GMP reductase